MADNAVSQDRIRSKYNEILRVAKNGGYFLNPDKKFTCGLVEGLLVNLDRYGFESCPCRLTIGPEEENLDIICPCYYRDEDITEYGCCYCGLYVSGEVSRGEKPVVSVPERRDLKTVNKNREDPGAGNHELSHPVFRCSVCGYLCARNSPPERCPVCGADQKRFVLFMK